MGDPRMSSKDKNKARKAKAPPPVKHRYVVDVLRNALVNEAHARREPADTGAFVFRGLGRLQGEYPRAQKPQDVLDIPAIRGAALKAITDRAESHHPVAEVAAAFCPTRMGPYYPDHESFDEQTRAVAVLGFGLFFPNNGPPPHSVVNKGATAA